MFLTTLVDATVAVWTFHIQFIREQKRKKSVLPVLVASYYAGLTIGSDDLFRILPFITSAAVFNNFMRLACVTTFVSPIAAWVFGLKNGHSSAYFALIMFLCLLVSVRPTKKNDNLNKDADLRQNSDREDNNARSGTK